MGRGRGPKIVLLDRLVLAAPLGPKIVITLPNIKNDSKYVIIFGKVVVMFKIDRMRGRGAVGV